MATVPTGSFWTNHQHIPVLEHPTLVLNKNWTPICVEPVEKVLAIVSKGNAKIVDPADYQQYTWDDWAKLCPAPGEHVVRTVSIRARVPEVIVLTIFDKVHARTVMFNRRNVFVRDQNICQYCGKKFKTGDLSIDHVLPLCQNGPNSWVNCVLACVNCNVMKGGRTPKQANMKLIREPFKPNWTPVFRSKMIKPTWGKFLDLDSLVSELYWNVELAK